MGEGAQLLQPACNRRSKAVLPRNISADYEVLGGLLLIGPVGAPQLLHLQAHTRPASRGIACRCRYLLIPLYADMQRGNGYINEARWVD